MDSPTDLFWILLLLPLIAYSASRVLLPNTWKSTVTLPRIGLGIATLVNLFLAYVVSATVYRARTSFLRAQEDVGVVMLILLAGGACILVCAVTALISAAVDFRKGTLSAKVFTAPAFLIGAANCVAPILLALVFLWLIRR